LKRRSSFGDDPSLLEVVDKWRTTAAAKLVQRLWVRPQLRKSAKLSEADNPKHTKFLFIYLSKQHFICIKSTERYQ
jgi:hypothetical protein